MTSWLIALLAAGMAAQSVQFLNNAGLVIVLERTVWDTSWLLSDGSLFGKLLHTLIGYTERPTELQLMTYIATLFAMFLLMRIARAGAAPARSRRRGINDQRRRPNAAKAAAGALLIILSSARAGPRGDRLPCSQLRTVSIGTSICSANAACVRPKRARTWRTNVAGLLWSSVFSLPSGMISTIRPSAFNRTRIMAVPIGGGIGQRTS